MRGWFDAFRTDGGPTLYSYSNRTPVTGDVPTITLYVLFFTLFIAFIIIFPGVRKERFTTFTSVTLSLFVGSAILVSKYGSAWHVADSSIMSYYRAFSREKLSADIGVHIGLMHFNVTLQGLPPRNDSFKTGPLQEDIDYNERFHWISATEIQDEFRAALVKGLPYPILTVVEYFNMDDEGFCWGRQYRHAGYYGSILLWASFASWLLMNLLIVVVPRYGAYQMVLTGSLMLSTNLVYYLLIPTHPLLIRFEDSILAFKFGWCYWLVLVAGALCFTVGSVIAIVDLIFPHKFSTILEVDYGTPFDRHIIIEDSHESRNKKKNSKRSLEEPEAIGLGRKILRTLSKREKNEDQDLRLASNGVENRGFEMDCPKSPWRYPHMMYRPDGTPVRPALQNAFARNPALARLAAPTPTKPKSVSFRRQSRLEQTFTADPIRLMRSDSKDSTASSSSSGIGQDQQDELPNFQSQFKPVERTDSQQSGSSESSFGLGLLSRTQSRRDPTNVSVAAAVHPHNPLTNKTSGSTSNDADLVPLNLMHYAPNKGLYQLPRASLERKASGEDENSSSRRSSDNSERTSRSGSNGFNPKDFSSHSQKRQGPDGHESDQFRRGSNESSSSQQPKQIRKESIW